MVESALVYGCVRKATRVAREPQWNEAPNITTRGESGDGAESYPLGLCWHRPISGSQLQFRGVDLRDSPRML